MTDLTLQHLSDVRAQAECLVSQAEMEQALDRLGQELTVRVGACNPIFLAVVVGGMVPVGLLMPRVHFPLQLDYVHATRYRNDICGKELAWVKEPSIALHQRTLVVIDDILDEGLTLQSVVDYCREQGAAEVLSLALVDKDRPRAPGGMAKADFTGVVIPNRYVFGYGLDYRGYWRNADGIYAVKGL